MWSFYDTALCGHFLLALGIGHILLLICLFCVYRLSSSIGASLVAQMVKNLPAMWETWIGSLGWEDPLEEGKVTHSSVLV